jgi:hypothetical protein
MKSIFFTTESIMKPLLLVHHEPNEKGFENEDVFIERTPVGIYFYAKDVEGYKIFSLRSATTLPYFIAYETASYILVAMVADDNMLSNTVEFTKADSTRFYKRFVNNTKNNFKIKLSSFQKQQEICVLFPEKVGQLYNQLRYMIRFEQASPLLKIINNQLTKKCPELSLDIRYDKWMHPTLCMVYRNKCISAVVFQIHGSEPILEISTETIEPFGNHKYNILLRGVAIILAHGMYFVKMVEGVKIMQPFTTICSYAINPISVYILVHYYKGYIVDPEIAKNFDTTALSAKSLFEKINDYYHPKSRRRSNIMVTVYVDLKNINHAMTTVKTLLAGPVRCIGNGTRKKMRARDEDLRD